MTAIRTGTRLEHLEALRRAVDLEIKAERLAHARGDRTSPRVLIASSPVPAPGTSPGQEPGPGTTLVTVPLEFVNRQKIRAWGEQQGLAVAAHGPVPALALDRFVDTHKPP